MSTEISDGIGLITGSRSALCALSFILDFTRAHVTTFRLLRERCRTTPLLRPIFSQSPFFCLENRYATIFNKVATR